MPSIAKSRAEKERIHEV